METKACWIIENSNPLIFIANSMGVTMDFSTPGNPKCTIVQWTEHRPWQGWYCLVYHYSYQVISEELTSPGSPGLIRSRKSTAMRLSDIKYQLWLCWIRSRDDKIPCLKVVRCCLGKESPGEGEESEAAADKSIVRCERTEDGQC